MLEFTILCSVAISTIIYFVSFNKKKKILPFILWTLLMAPMVFVGIYGVIYVAMFCFLLAIFIPSLFVCIVLYYMW